MRVFSTLFSVLCLCFVEGGTVYSAPLPQSGGVRYRDEIFSNVTVTSDIVYGQAYNVSYNRNETLKLDLYQPQGDNEAKRPAILWVHAGGLKKGSKTGDEVVELSTRFAKRGYVTASNNYRLHTAPESNQQEALLQAYEDAKAAIRWLRANAAAYRIDTDRISIGGMSSGGGVSLAAAYEENEGSSGNPGYSSEVSACMEGSASLDDDTDMEIGEAPFCIIHGTVDDKVPYSEALELEARAIEVGVPYELNAVQGAGHGLWLDGYKELIVQKWSDFNYKYVATTGPNGPPSITINDVSVTEGNAGTVDAVFTVSMSEATASGQVATVEYATGDNTATANDDYVSTSGTISFPAGTTTQTISVTVNGDQIDEQDETFFLNIKRPDNARITDLQGRGTIVDDEAGAPSPPSNLTATASGTSTVNLSWSDNSSDEDGFKIERKTGSSSFSEIASVDPNVTSLSDNSLTPGTTYSYRVRAFNGNGNSTYSNTASATTSCDVAADFSGTNRSGCSPLTVDFNDLSTGPITSWSWNFGDGGNSTSPSPSHTYTSAGTYTVSLTVSSANCSGTETKTGYVTVSGAPAAAFTGSPTSGNAPLTVNFTDQSTGSPTSWSWDFGDGGTSTTRNPSHQYSAAGKYTVSLTATNDCGSDGETKVDYINVTTVPVNLALNKPATASSTYSGSSYTPSKAFDGSTSTYWRSGSLSSSNQIAWLRVDLESTQTVGRAVVKWRSSYYAKKYELQVSNDDINWTTVYINNAGTSGTQDFTFASTTARYVRIYMTQKNSSSYRINELEVYSGPSGGSRAHIPDLMESPLIVPEEIELHANYPNPFNPSTTIRFGLPSESHVSLKVYNLLGQEVATLVDERRIAGFHTVIFQPTELSSGVYFYVLQAGEARLTHRLVFMK